HERPSDERRDEQIALPGRKQLAVVERDACRRDVRRPEVDGLFHAVLGGLVAVDGLAGILAPVADDWKAVVLALRDDRALVAAARAVLARPQPAGARLNRDALHVAEADRVNLGMRAGVSDERVVFRNRAVWIDPQDLPHVARQLLRLRPVDGIDADA